MAGNNLYLVGYRATGKTTVAKYLGEYLDRDVVDADDLVEQRAGMSIKEIFSAHGEEHFRGLETAVLEELVRLSTTIVALGGGAVLRPGNRLQLQATGRTIWLRATAETIHQRIGGDPLTVARRPNLTNAGGLEEIRDLLSAREAVYRECADFEVDTEDRSPEAVADMIHRWLDRK